MKMETIVARHALNLLPVDKLPGIAVEMLEAGFDSPALRQLAGANDRSAEEIHRLFEKTIGELQLHVPSRQEAGIALAREIATEVVTGAITPYAGASRIWHEVYTLIPELEQLRGFVGLASEYEDDLLNRHRDEYARDIVNACQALLRQTPNGTQG